MFLFSLIQQTYPHSREQCLDLKLFDIFVGSQWSLSLLIEYLHKPYPDRDSRGKSLISKNLHQRTTLDVVTTGRVRFFSDSPITPLSCNHAVVVASGK